MRHLVTGEAGEIHIADLGHEIGGDGGDGNTHRDEGGRV
jgi:hypothetical protein